VVSLLDLYIGGLIACNCKYREAVTFNDQFTSIHLTVTSELQAEATMNFSTESISLMADNVWNEAVTLHRSQKVLKVLSLYMHARTHTSLHTSRKGSGRLFDVIVQKYLQFSINIFFSFFHSGVTLVNSVLQTTPEEKKSQ
jgi:hypothetical protein